MYVIKMMDFYVCISNIFEEDEESARKVDYVSRENATQYESISDAALDAEAMNIHGFEVEKF